MVKINPTAHPSVICPITTPQKADPSEEVVASERKVQISGRSMIDKPFYVYEHAPWLKPYQSPAGRELWESKTDEERDGTKEKYLNTLRLSAETSLNGIFEEYFGIKHDLKFLNPELAEKYFSFTLDAEGNIKVTDPDKVLTPSDLDYLQEIFSQRANLKDKMHNHARAVMAYVDHNSKTFDNRFMLRLENYEATIDYVELLARNPRGNFMWGLEDQIIRRCSARTGSLFETTA
ncbi:hypothetical protein [Pseudomonas syringae]|uniref:hypothetical protein n=1 Tax=Pseudomonas syringae TaxID=317 RepID=UPI0008169405|nr:hypothetical protein [Pseudomonas syringae]